MLFRSVGCAGSDHTTLRVALSPVPLAPAESALRVALVGAKGGHSGADITAGRVNAIKALGRILAAAFDAAPFRLVSFDGGVSRNAIPRDAVAVVAATDPAFEETVRAEAIAIARQYACVDDGITLELASADAGHASSEATTRAVLDLVAGLPTGVVAMAPRLTHTVETSISLTVAHTEADELALSSMARSSNAAALDDLLARMHALGRLGGATIETRRSYPPWEPSLDSELLRTAKASFTRLFGTEPDLAVVHGGLECAVLGQRLEGVEMISIGPEIVGPHAPGERVRISSTQHAYRLLGALLDDLSS